VRILINGSDLRTLVGELEVTSAAATGSAGPAGAYHYLSGYHFPSGVFEGRPDDPGLLREGQVTLMGCDCGEVGCWPFLASISVQDGAVRWTGFRQPFRPAWTYDALGTLRFDADEYFHEIARARDRFSQVARLPDELLAARAASVREQIEISLEVTQGLLCGWHRRAELPRMSAADRELIRSDRTVLEAAIEEIMRRLDVTYRQGMVIARRDIHAVPPAEIVAREAFEAELRALRGAPDSAVRDGYNIAVDRLQGT
jgi:hypothetical protein